MFESGSGSPPSPSSEIWRRSIEVKIIALWFSWAAGSFSAFLGAMFYDFGNALPRGFYTHLVGDRLSALGFIMLSVVLNVVMTRLLGAKSFLEGALRCGACLAATFFGALAMWRMMGL